MYKQNRSFLDKIVKTEKGQNPLDGSLGQGETGPKQNVFIENQGGNGYQDKEVEKANWMPEEVPETEDGQLAIDVYQDDDFVIIKSIVGGVKPEDLDLSVTADMVTIKGSREKNEEIAEENYYYQECFWGSFSRSVILPCDIKTDQVEASMKNGILTIKMPKVEKNSATKITVRGE